MAVFGLFVGASCTLLIQRRPGCLVHLRVPHCMHRRTATLLTEVNELDMMGKAMIIVES
jgi:hypothetical protein